MKFRANKKSGLVEVSEILRYLYSVPDGEYVVEVKKSRKRRSNDQNAYLWGAVYPTLLNGLIDAGWEFTDTEQVHEFFKAQMTEDKVINKHTGEIIEFPSSTAKMDTVTFSTYIDKLRDYAIEFLGIEIPEPTTNY